MDILNVFSVVIIINNAIMTVFIFVWHYMWEFLWVLFYRVDLLGHRVCEKILYIALSNARQGNEHSFISFLILSQNHIL